MKTTPSNFLKPFWRYYGGKYRAAPRYPIPVHKTIFEPFAGAAGYSLRYHWLDIILTDKSPIVAGIWQYLIRATRFDIISIPDTESIEDLPASVSQEAKWLIGFWLNNATVTPSKTLSAGRRKLAATGRNFEGWNQNTKERIARQIHLIRHWKCICGDYRRAINRTATWFIDPPYNNRVGRYYPYSDIDYKELGNWCRLRLGQVIVCENEGADWLPFEPFHLLKPGFNSKGSQEVIYTQGG